MSEQFCHSDWGISKLCILNASTGSWGVEKRRTYVLYFMWRNKKKSFGAKADDLSPDDLSNQCFECSKVQLMCERFHCRREELSVFGRWFFERQLANKWFCTPQNWLFWVALVVRLRNVQLSEKTGDHLLGSVSSESNFCWFWLILKHPYSWLLFTFGLTRVNLRFIACPDIVDVFRSSAIVFLRAFLSTNRREPYLSDWQIMWDPTRTNFFGSQMFIQIECMLVPLMP